MEMSGALPEVPEQALVLGLGGRSRTFRITGRGTAGERREGQRLGLESESGALNARRDSACPVAGVWCSRKRPPSLQSSFKSWAVHADFIFCSMVYLCLFPCLE